MVALRCQQAKQNAQSATGGQKASDIGSARTHLRCPRSAAARRETRAASAIAPARRRRRRDRARCRCCCRRGGALQATRPTTRPPRHGDTAGSGARAPAAPLSARRWRCRSAIPRDSWASVARAKQRDHPMRSACRAGLCHGSAHSVCRLGRGWRCHQLRSAPPVPAHRRRMRRSGRPVAHSAERQGRQAVSVVRASE